MLGRPLLGGMICVSFVVVTGILRDQTIQIITVRAVSAEGPFIEQAFDSTSQANLVGMLLVPYWPAHLTMPASSKNQNCSPSHTRSH